MSSQSTQSRHVLRQLLRAVLPTDADFSAFCVDFFPEAAERFSGGMDRIAKATLLLELSEAEAIRVALEHYDPERFAEFERRRDRAASSPSNPYRGLSAFQLHEAHLFFGREALTGHLWQRIEALFEEAGATRVLAIIGPSGSGKSSVARAGLLAALVRSPLPGPLPMRLVLVKPGERPIESLARELVPLLPPDTSILPARRQVDIEELLTDKKIPAQGLRRFAADLPEIAASPLVVLVDQFEELYTLCKDPAERDAFVETLLHAATDSRRQVSVVLAFRSDFLCETQRHHNQLNRVIAAQGVIVPALSPDELRDAIAKPAQQAGRPIDPATVELLLTETRGSQGALPLLEFALTRIWEGMESGEEPSATLRRLGGVGGALAGVAHKIYGSLSVSEQVMARRALVRLVRLGEGTRDTRRRVLIRDLCGRGETEIEVLHVLRKFSHEQARLLTLSAEQGVGWAEVTHEALLEHWNELRKWIDENRDDRRFHDRVADAARLWNDAGQPAGRLWRSPDLDLLHSYQRRHPEDLSAQQEAFLLAADRQLRRERTSRWSAISLVILAAIITAGGYAQKNRQIHEQLIGTYVERGRQLLIEQGNSVEALPWLHRAQAAGSNDPILPDLLRTAMWTIDSTHAVLVGHESGVRSAMYSPDGRRIITASVDGTARLWSAESGRLLTVLKGHRGAVIRATYSPDGHRIVTASIDKTARVWEAETGRLLAELKGHTGDIKSATYSPDGRYIATASWDNTGRIWEADSGQLLVELKGHRDRVYNTFFSPDGRHVLTSSEDKTARVWEARTGNLVLELKDPGGIFPGTASYSPDGRHIVTTSFDGISRVWTADAGRLAIELRVAGLHLNLPTYSPDGRRIVTVSGDHAGQIWDSETGRLISGFTGHSNRIESIAFSPDGLRIVTASFDKSARVWDMETGRPIAEFRGHDSHLFDAKYSPDGHHIVTASWDTTARIWDVGPTRLVKELVGHRDIVLSAAYSPDGTRIVTASADKTARIWRADTGSLILEFREHGGGVSSARFSPDGRRIVTGSADNLARVWDADTGELVVELRGHTGAIVQAAYSPDGRHIVTASKDTTARIWEADSGRTVSELRGHVNSIQSVIYSTDGRRILTASYDGQARMWDSETGRHLSTLDHSSYVATLSPNGQQFVTAGIDYSAYVSDTKIQQILSRLIGHSDAVWSVAYSGDSQRIVTGGVDQTARVWDAETGRCSAVLRGHGNIVSSVMFSPDGRRIVTASYDKTARVWDVSRESRGPEEISKLMHCYLPIHFADKNSTILVSTRPKPTECQDKLRIGP